VLANAPATEQSDARSEAAQPEISAGSIEDLFSSGSAWEEHL
jgi:hypothetical protein